MKLGDSLDYNEFENVIKLITNFDKSDAITQKEMSKVVRQIFEIFD